MSSLTVLEIHKVLAEGLFKLELMVKNKDSFTWFMTTILFPMFHFGRLKSRSKLAAAAFHFLVLIMTGGEHGRQGEGLPVVWGVDGGGVGSGSDGRTLNSGPAALWGQNLTRLDVG